MARAARRKAWARGEGPAKSCGCKASAQATIVRTFSDGSSEPTSRTDELKDLRAAPRTEYTACSVPYDSRGCWSRQAALQKESSALCTSRKNARFRQVEEMKQRLAQRKP